MKQSADAIIAKITANCRTFPEIGAKVEAQIMTHEILAPGIEIYCADCRSILYGHSVQAIVTDPPYGIGECQKRVMSRGQLAKPKDYGDFKWDAEPATKESIELILARSDYQIIFGGNYFSLPPSPCWLVWDKQNGTNDFADCELAWTNLKMAVRRIVYRWNGMLKQFPEERFHPTQKPVAVMEWAIKHLPDSAETICDPMMGSGTTGVAAVKLGRKFIGIEISPEYYEIAKARIVQAIEEREMDMFKDQPQEPEQLDALETVKSSRPKLTIRPPQPGLTQSPYDAVRDNPWPKQGEY